MMPTLVELIIELRQRVPDLHVTVLQHSPQRLRERLLADCFLQLHIKG
jgi:hypothetical protein